MPRLLVIASKLGYQTRAFAAAAARNGYSVQMATDRCQSMDDPWGDGAIALKFYLPEKAAAVIAEQAAGIDGIIAPGDRPALIAALTAARLGLEFHPAEAVAAARNKHLARERFAAAGLPVPAHRLIPLDTADPSPDGYPCVLKPTGLSGSRGVIRANNREEFAAAFRRIRDLLGTPDILRLRDPQDRFLQVEEFIPGREFAVEGLMTAGEFMPIAIFDKPDPLDGPFFEETIYVTPSREAAGVQSAIVEATRRGVAALGLRHGPVHAEMRVNEAGVWMLEIAARPIGGLCARTLRFEDGSNLEDVLCRHAAGEEVGRPRLAQPARGVMMIPIPRAGVYRGVRGLGEALDVEGIEEIEITAKEGQRLVPLPEGSSYLGFIFAGGDSPDRVERALREAHEGLKFEIATELGVVR